MSLNIFWFNQQLHSILYRLNTFFNKTTLFNFKTRLNQQLQESWSNVCLNLHYQILSILFINILYYKNKLYINKLIYDLFLLYIHESILIRSGLRALIESSRIYKIFYRLIIELNFVFTNNSFNNRFENDFCSTSWPYDKKLTTTRSSSLIYVS
jgi:hypothetical protein